MVLRTVVEKSTIVSLTHASELKQLFPHAKFILYYRDPLANIEGLQRKWALFREAPLEALADFWADCFWRGLEELEAMPETDVMCLKYEAVVQAPLDCVEQVRQFLKVPLRAKPKRLPDRPNVPGKALRNVSNGLIRIEKGADAQSITRLTPAQVRLIEVRTQPVQQALETFHFT